MSFNTQEVRAKSSAPRNRSRSPAPRPAIPLELLLLAKSDCRISSSSRRCSASSSASTARCSARIRFVHSVSPVSGADTTDALGGLRTGLSIMLVAAVTAMVAGGPQKLARGRDLTL